MAISGTHDHFLVALSILVAAAASYTALDLASRVHAATGWASRAWLATAATAMGGGIWSMHFVAMLAFSMEGMDVGYDPGLTILSLLLAIGATAVAFAVVSRAVSGRSALVVSGLFMGLGIAAMHYTGMAAMRMHAGIRYDLVWVATSVAIAIAAATTALHLAFRRTGSYSRLSAAVVMGFAIAGMHYAGMQGSAFEGHGGMPMEHGQAGLDQIRLALAVAATTFLILFLASVAAMFDRRFAVLAEREATMLRVSEERFRTLYRMTPLPIHYIDSDGVLRHVSDAWLDLLGYGRDEVIGRPLTDFMADVPPHQHDRLCHADEVGDVELRLVSKDGSLRDVVLSSRAGTATSGEPEGTLGGIVDVTARKLAEEALRQAQKIEAVGQLTGGVAHDFNNLLAVVLGNLELLRKRLPDDGRSLRMLDNAAEGARRGAALTQRLLAFSRRQDLKPEAVNVVTLVHGMSDLLQRTIGPGIRIDSQFPLDLPRAQVDANQFELALLNLAVNARDAMPEGGAITIGAKAVSAGAYVCVSVADTGEGMDEATLARAREPFFTTKGVGKGTGLGLSMVHGLAEQSGGRLELTSRKGLGTVAEIWLPVATETSANAVAQVPREAVPARPETSRLTILVVDDDPLVMSNTAEMLEDLGHAALRASSAQEALRHLRENRDVDLLLTDHAMPGMTGSQLAAVVRLDHPGLPIILASGYAELSADARGDLFRLHKPFDQDALIRAIDAQIGSRDGKVIPFQAKKA